MFVPDPLGMERFFFHLISDDEVIRDEAGICLAAEESIPLYVVRALKDLREEGFFASGGWQGWQIEITDCTGRAILTFPLVSGEGEPSLPLH
jgi:hypothetical protein